MERFLLWCETKESPSTTIMTIDSAIRLSGILMTVRIYPTVGLPSSGKGVAAASERRRYNGAHLNPAERKFLQGETTFDTQQDKDGK